MIVLFRAESADIFPKDVAHVRSEGEGESPIYSEHLLFCFMTSFLLLQSEQTQNDPFFNL